MKKLVLIFVCVAAIAAGTFVVLNKQPAEEDFLIEDVLPQKALFYTKVVNITGVLRKLEAMPLWKILQTINYDHLRRKNVLNQQQMIVINAVKKKLPEVINHPLRRKLVGKEVVMVAYPPQGNLETFSGSFDDLAPELLEDLFSGVYFVTRIGSDAQLVEYFSRFFKDFGDNVSQTNIKYKEETIHLVTISDGGIRIGFARLDNLLVFGIGEKSIQKSIDVFKGEKPSLSQDEGFQKVYKKFQPSFDSVAFINFKVIKEILEGQMTVLKGFTSQDKGDVWGQVLNNVKGIEAFGFSSHLSSPIRLDHYLIFDPAALSSDMALAYTCAPQENETISFVPKDVLGYQWSNCLRLGHYWDQIVGELENQNESDSKVGEIEQMVGLSIADKLLPMFGDEIGGYLKDVEIGMFPLPKFLLFIKIKDQSGVEGLLGKLEQQPLIALQEENYQGSTIKYFPLPLGKGIQPGYCFLKDYLLVTTSRQLIKDSLEAFNNKEMALPSSPDFKEIDFGLTKKNRAVQFVRIKDIVGKIGGVIQWASQWMDVRDQKADAFKSGRQKPLEEVVADIAAKEKELDEIRENIISLEDEIWNMESKGEDVSSQQLKYEDLKNQMDQKKEEIVELNERRKELAKITQEPTQKISEAEIRRVYLTEVVYPILDGFKLMESYGFRSTVSGDSIESTMFLKMAE